MCMEVMNLMINKRERSKIKAKLFFRWFDLWIGCYIDKPRRSIYVCLIPMVGIKFWINNR